MGSTLKNCDEEDILRWLKVGDDRQKQHAMDCLYSRFCIIVIDWVKKNGGSEEDGHDTLSDALLSLGDIIGALKYKHEGKFEAYFMTIAKFKFYNICRKRKKENSKGGLLSLDDIFPNGIPDEILWENAFDMEDISESELTKLKLIEDCLNQLGDRYKDRLVRFYYLDQSHEEIAHALGDSSANVSKVMKGRGFKELNDCVHMKAQLK